MRATLLMLLLITAIRAGDALGIWEMKAARSTFGGVTPPKSLTLRIELHAKGEVFTLDRVEADGRATTSSTILYLDGKPRDFQDLGCSGTQSSRRVESQTVEILHKCATGEWTQFIRRLSARPEELILEITEQHADGRRFESRLVLERERRDR